MSDKLRSVNTKFWDDPFIEELNTSEKLLFLYFLTNSQTNLLGIYEITLKRIAYETGINQQTVQNGLKSFERAKKIFYTDNFIILPNFLKNQNLNANMKKGVVKLFEDLPIHLKNSLITNDSETIPNDYQTILNTLLKYEKEIEDETEIEKETKIKYDLFVSKFNEIRKSKFQTSDKKAKEQFLARLKEGATIETLLTALKNAMTNERHIESSFNYLTPEFITRSDKYAMYSNYVLDYKSEKLNKQEYLKEQGKMPTYKDMEAKQW